MSYTERPVIGIVCKYTSKSSNSHDTSCMIRQEVLQAIIDHDALPACITLPCIERPRIHANPFGNLTSLEQEILREQIHRCDGLIFQGGQHIEDFEYEAALYAHIKDIPALGFCSGQTVMASIDTTKLVDLDPCVHNVPHQELVHSVKVVPDTLFHRIVGTYELVVNSRHSKAIAACSNLKISFFISTPSQHLDRRHKL